MLVALTVWEGRISPLFDATRTLLIAQVEGGRATSRRLEPFDCESAAARAARLANLGVHVLICGGISSLFADMVEARGVRIIAFVAGVADEVLAAYVAGCIDRKKFRMPGCEKSAARPNPLGENR